jgi:small subunit ribosomal protein S1
VTDPRYFSDSSDSGNEFAALFEESTRAKPLQKGQTIDGTIVAMNAEVAFVNVGGKGEATIALDELKNDDGLLEAAVGDRIQATVVSTMGGITLSRRMLRGAASLRQIEDAFRAGLAVEGKVMAVVKGGFEVTVARQRAFCPFSQMDVIRGTDPTDHIGHVYAFRITEFKEGGRNLVVSRRVLLEEAQKAGAAELRKSIVAGAVMKGRVVSVRDFCAFVELGAGVQGLLHVSEMGWTRVPDPTKLLTPGQEIEVKVLRVEADGEKIALGLRQLTVDPWTTVAEHYAVGQVVEGRVTRHAEFGAFVELEPGVEGLAHASTFPPTGGARAWTRAYPVGATVQVEVLGIDQDKKRIGVGIVKDGVTRSGEATDAREYAERAASASAESFGSLADKLRGAIGTRK